MDQGLACQPALRHIEPDMVATVREDGMVIAVRIGDDGQPGGDALQIETIGIGTIGGDRFDAQRSRV